MHFIVPLKFGQRLKSKTIPYGVALVPSLKIDRSIHDRSLYVGTIKENYDVSLAKAILRRRAQTENCSLIAGPYLNDVVRYKLPRKSFS